MTIYAAPFGLTLLASIAGRTTEEFRVVRRARMVLACLEGRSISAAAALFGCDRKTLRRWVERWASKPEVESLRDLHRTGRKPKFGLGETARILTMVSQPPAEYGIVTVTWYQEQIVEVLAEQGVVMSRSSVQRVLARQDIDVRRVKYWLFTPKDREDFRERRDAICSLYRDMPLMAADEIVVCFDAKPGIQILANPKGKAGNLGLVPGKPRRIEFEYRRMGTRSFVAAVSPLTGKVLHHDLYGKDRPFDSTETISFLEILRIKLAQMGFNHIHLVLDNGSTHISNATKSYFSQQANSFTTHYTPVHASWLNLCENFFSIFSRRYLKNRRYASLDEFVAGVPLWINDHDRRCHPLRWTYASHQKAA